MAVSPFSITPTPPTAITLDPGQDGRFSFTVTCLAAPDKSFALLLQALLVESNGETRDAAWLVVGPQSTLSMTGGQTETVAISVRPTAATPRGRYSIKLAVADKDRPNDTYAYSAPVACELKIPDVPPPPPKKIPWWLIAAIAGGVVLLVGGGILIGRLASRGGSTTIVDAGSGKPVADAAVHDAAVPPAFAPLHVQTVLSSAPDLILGGPPVMINTTARTINGATSPFFVQQGGYAVLFANAFAVQSPVVITGTSPLVIVARDRVTITANIDLEANGTVPGPGAAPVGHPGAGGAGVTVTVANPEGRRPVSSGGGGGSYGTLGGPGGSSIPAQAPAGTSGVRYGMQIDDALIGGAPGGPVGAGNNGGGGGGALQISSAVSIQVSATINAGGGGGGAGGGGGGAGGEILLEAPMITISGAGTLAANGGGGGGGRADGSMPAHAGESGLPGRPASGGEGGVPGGSRGGNGAAGIDDVGNAIEAQPGDASNINGGGGGGGAGRIWLRYRGSTPPSLNGRITPPPGKDPSLP